MDQSVFNCIINSFRPPRRASRNIIRGQRALQNGSEITEIARTFAGRFSVQLPLRVRQQAVEYNLLRNKTSRN